MKRRTFMKAAVIAAATPTVTAFADTADHVTLAHLLDLHTRAYEADSVDWGRLNDIQEEAAAADTLPVSREPDLLQALCYHEQRQRCEDSRTSVRRMEAAVFAYHLQSIDDVLLLTRWVHTRLADCRCYFYEEQAIIQSIFAQIAQAHNVSKVDA